MDSANRGRTTLTLADKQRDYWRRNLRIISVLIGVWVLVTFGVAYFARELSFDFFGWPFSFWVGGQGAPVVYLLLICYYLRAMNRMDHEFGVADEE